MEPYLLQKQIKDNANDLQEFCKDLKVWGDQMKTQEERKKNPLKIHEKNNSATKTKKKVITAQTEANNEKNLKNHKVIDYAAWDKFDVEAECAKVDKNSSEESDISDEVDEASLDFAMQEKEKGNKFVKEKKWNEAIKCYTSAIDTYAYDPIFYANRALCFLKLENYKKAEADCTIALKLDNTYVKAFQRRAAARQKLNLLIEAKTDLMKVLEFEPKNNETRIALDNLEELLKTSKNTIQVSPKFKPCGQKKDKTSLKECVSSSNDKIAFKNYVKENVEQPRLQTVVQAKIETNRKTPIWPSNGNIEIIKPIYKLPNLRSKKPLKRIQIEEVDYLPTLNAVNKNVVSMPKSDAGNSKIINLEKFKVIEKFDNKTKLKEEKFFYPKTAIQFYNSWKAFGNTPDLKFKYLKQINPKEINLIFKDSLDTKVFSDIIETLANEFIKKSEPVYEYLKGLTQVKRFSALAMFMTSQDKKNLLKLIDYLKGTSALTEEDINALITNYELKY